MSKSWKFNIPRDYIYIHIKNNIFVLVDVPLPHTKLYLMFFRVMYSADCRLFMSVFIMYRSRSGSGSRTSQCFSSKCHIFKKTNSKPFDFYCSFHTKNVRKNIFDVFYHFFQIWGPFLKPRPWSGSSISINMDPFRDPDSLPITYSVWHFSKYILYVHKIENIVLSGNYSMHYFCTRKSLIKLFYTIIRLIFTPSLLRADICSLRGKVRIYV